jgi:hypothetical protein
MIATFSLTNSSVRAQTSCLPQKLGLPQYPRVIAMPEDALNPVCDPKCLSPSRRLAAGGLTPLPVPPCFLNAELEN